MDEANAKVLIRVTNPDGPDEVETLWAFPLGDDLYRLDNHPFYAYGVSCSDVVYAPFSDEEQMATFLRIESKSGNRTVRVIVDPPFIDGNESEQLIHGLVSLGCTFEGANSVLFSINVPSKVDLGEIRQYLLDRGAQWEHADPTYEMLFPSK